MIGPQSQHVSAMLERMKQFTSEDATALDNAWYAPRPDGSYGARTKARSVAWYAAKRAAEVVGRQTAADAAVRVARHATGPPGGYAVMALVTRDLISAEYYAILTAPWRRVIGKIHPDDDDDD